MLLGTVGCGSEESVSSEESDKQDNGLQRISKEYSYEEVGECDESADWFVISDELFGITDSNTFGRYDKEEGYFEEIGYFEYYYTCSYDSKWLVFQNNEGLYKYDIENHVLDILTTYEEVEVYDLGDECILNGRAVVANGALYYHSTKKDPTRAEGEPDDAIWRIDLTTGEETKAIENAGDECGLMADLENHDLFYFYGDCGNIIKYDCVSGEQEIIMQGMMGRHYLLDNYSSSYAINGRYYILDNDALYLMKDEEAICLKENCVISPYVTERKVIYSNGYLTFNTANEIIVVDNEDVYVIDKDQELFLNDYNDRTKVILVEDNKVWFDYTSYSAYAYYVKLFFADFEGNISKSTEGIKLDSGEYMGYIDHHIYINGTPVEEWEINKEVDKAVIDELKKQGIDVAMHGTFDNGKTKLEIYPLESGDGVYKIPLD